MEKEINRTSRRFLVRAALVGLVLATLVYTAPGHTTVGAQEPPSVTFRYAGVFPVSAPAAQYDVVLNVMDFSAGAATPERRSGGMAFVTVIEGQVHRTQSAVETRFGTGERFSEPIDTVYSIANKGSGPARLLVSYLISPGQPDFIDHPDSPVPARLPVTTFAGRMTVGTQAAQIGVTQGLADFVPGAASGLHAHSGSGITMQLVGETVDRFGSTEVRRKVGDPFVEVRGRPTEHLNVSQSPATVAFVFLNTMGVPALLPITASSAPAPALSPASATGPSVRPPSTGDAGLLAQEP